MAGMFQAIEPASEWRSRTRLRTGWANGEGALGLGSTERRHQPEARPGARPRPAVYADGYGRTLDGDRVRRLRVLYALPLANAVMIQESPRPIS